MNVEVGQLYRKMNNAKLGLSIQTCSSIMSGLISILEKGVIFDEREFPFELVLYLMSICIIIKDKSTPSLITRPRDAKNI